MSVTIKDVAKAAGVNISTVSRSLNDSPLISDKTKERVKKIAKEMNFEINANARTLITKKSNIIGIVYPEEMQDFDFGLYHVSLLNNLRSILEKENLYSIVTFPENQYTKKSNIYTLISQKKIDGLLIINENLEKKDWNYIKKNNTPCVFLHYIPNIDILDKIDVITTDHFSGGKIAAEYLLSLGHREILYITKDSTEQEYKRRLEGYEFALAESGVKIKKNDIVKIKFSVESIRDFVSKNIELIKTKTAIFALNDLTAINMINELKKYGINVPEDISIIGYDDIEGLDQFCPVLTTIHQPRETISKLGCERLISLLKDNSGKENLNIQVRPSLVVRNSCKKI